VRSRLDRLKGGGLARLAAPARVIGLILSDVVGDPLEVIASGLTNDPRAQNVLVGNNTQACEAAADAARGLGYHARIVTTQLRGEARERGAEIAREIVSSPPGAPPGNGVCLVYGGETTVTLRGDGMGGRNQELALAAAIALAALDPQAQTGALVASVGTDGTDGPTDAAGAVAFPDTLDRARARGLDAGDFLARNDSYRFFAALGDLAMTGPTGTNVADVVVAMRPAR
jgi:hydroxypyruvate reductase